jgi:hypothetical protein
VALSAEEVRGPPQRNTLINSAISARLPGYNGIRPRIVKKKLFDVLHPDGPTHAPLR